MAQSKKERAALREAQKKVERAARKAERKRREEEEARRRHDRRRELIGLWGAVVGTASLIVAILAWLSPVSPPDSGEEPAPAPVDDGPGFGAVVGHLLLMALVLGALMFLAGWLATSVGFRYLIISGATVAGVIIAIDFLADIGAGLSWWSWPVAVAWAGVAGFLGFAGAVDLATRRRYRSRYGA